MFAGSTEVRANRIDVGIVDKKEKKVMLIQMRCPWISNRGENGKVCATEMGDTSPVPGLHDH